MHLTLAGEEAPPLMFPFWDVAIRPIIEAAGARRVLEIGALRGDTTTLMLEALGPDVELHVIDPVPAFDPSEHEQAFPGRYHFHRDLSLNVLPGLEPVDVALVDGDHNWYTVYNELRLLAENARSAGVALPVFILHDVGWPYGRRDLYYDPDTVPEEFRQPYAQRGIVRGRSELAKSGGLNPTMNNALAEGGSRNGVMTAVDDFVAESPEDLRVLFIPIYFGLAVVVEASRLDEQPALAKAIAYLEEADGRGELLELAETVRIQAMLFQHNVFFRADKQRKRAADRYLDLLKGALVDDHYLENELRIELIMRSAANGLSPERNSLRDPVRHMKEKTRIYRAAHRSGLFREGDKRINAYFPYTTAGRVRLDHLQTWLETIRDDSVSGDLVDAGTGRGGIGIFLRGFLDIHEINGPKVWVADRFRATPDPDDEPADDSDDGFPECRADINNVRDAFERFDLFDDRVRFLQGPFDTTLPDAPIERIAMLRIGARDEDVGVVLEQLYDRVTLGGFVVVDRYDHPATAEAVDAFRTRRRIPETLERIDWAAAGWRKTEHAPGPVATEATPMVAAERVGPPLAPPPPARPRDLTVVVVFYNMKREAARTLRSLSRSYQQGIDDLDYEVIAIENGSAPEQRLGEDFVRGFGPEFRYVDLGADATPSPIPALNRGLELGAGRNFAFMIDGAHVLTPGVLRFGMAGLTTYEPAIVATQQWYVGPGQQPDAIDNGYDQEYEDRLFDEIMWPTDGYRLFDVGHFIGARDWLDGLWESNCIFVPRNRLEQVGGFDEGFSMPGGGFANLEFYERMGSSPDVTVVTMLGEGSFHQVHGGTTTNLKDAEKRHATLAGYAQHFDSLRGRGFFGHRKRIHYVGSMFDEASRTRARRRVAPNYFRRAAAGEIDGPPDSPMPISQDLQLEYTDAIWRSMAWKNTTWLGQRVGRLPSDLFAYQDLITEVRPDWIIDVSTGNGGRALFLASICELLDSGQVVTIDRQDNDRRPQHERIHYLTAPTQEPETAELVRSVVGESPRAIVILGSRGSAKRMSQEFQLYSPFVPVGSYLVMEDTIVNGHPVWAAFGPGPAEAVKGIVEVRGDFASSQDVEKYKLSFNPGGYLKRLS